MVAVGFEPTKHNANDLKSFPFDLTREYYLVGKIGHREFFL